MTSLRKFRSQRSGHRQDVSKRLGVIAEMLANYVESMRVDLEAAKLALVSKRDICFDLDIKILDSFSEDTAEELVTDEIMGASNFADEITKALIRIDKVLETRVSLPERRSSVHGGTRSSIESGGSSSSVRVRLPKLELVKFNGDPKLFQHFWDSFQSVIHNNEALSDIDRFNYLRTQLVGAAASAIAGLPSTSENYKEAVEILIDRFGKKSVIISSHMDALMKLPIVINSADTNALRRVYDKIETHFRSLDTLGIKSETYGALLVPVILSRLPEELKLILSRNFAGSGEIWELQQLLKGLKQEIEARERSQLVTAGGKSHGNIAHAEKPTAAALLTQSGPNENNCCFCRGRHSSNLCKIVSNVDARKSLLIKSRRCFVCLRPGHLAKSCRSPPCIKCMSRHNAAICTKFEKEGEALKNKVDSKGQQSENFAKEKTVGASNALFVDVATSVLLQTAIGLASSPTSPLEEKSVRLIMDPGSQRSYVKADLFNCLELPCVGKERLLVNTFGGKSSVVESCPITQLRVRGRFGGQEIFITACVVPEICTPPGNQQVQFATENFKHLADLQLADDVSLLEGVEGGIDILIGSDFYWAFVLDGKRRGKSGPVAINTRLGWVLSGPIYPQSLRVATQNERETLAMNCFNESQQQNELHSVLSKFWTLESLGIDTNEEDKPLQKFSDNLKFDGKRYEVALPFRENYGVLADNYQHSHDRLQSLLKRLRRNRELGDQYDAIMTEQLESGVLEGVSADPPTVGKVYYMPHLGVVRKDKDTTKLRIVYDASSKIVGPSLNQCLYEGPSLLPEIFNILLTFRFFPIGITADIEKAFLQVSVRKEDRDFLRVLWVDDLNAEVPKEVALRFTRCVFGVASSPFHLNATLLYHMNKYDQINANTVATLKRSLYVDDVTVGVDSVEEGFSFFRTSRSIMSDGGFNLRKWATNSDELVRLISLEVSSNQADDNQTYSSFSTQNSQRASGSQEQKVLGVMWNRQCDELKFRFEGFYEAANNTKLTKRNVLSLIARNYDPLGLISPLFTPLKVAFQKICMQGGSWDDEVGKEEAALVNGWLLQVKEGQEISVPRYCLGFSKGEISSYQLVGFCDASMYAYGASIYVRTETLGGVSSHLLVSKTKVAPLKKLSIPRLELLGMLVLARLLSSCLKVIPSALSYGIKLFSDSATALYWVKSDCKRYKQWVERRVDAIRGLTTVDLWAHIKGEENPADLQSRGTNLNELKYSEVWFHGPIWIRRAQSEWPANTEIEETEISKDEIRVGERQPATTACIVHSKEHTPLVDYNRFSTVGKLIRVIAYVLKFIRCLRLGVSRSGLNLELTADELNLAEKFLIRDAQAYFKAENNFQILSKQLLIFEDDAGLLRSKSRFENADLLQAEKFPLVMSKVHRLSELIVRDCHERVFHRGASDTMEEVRAKYWIPSLRQLAKRVIHSCYACRRMDGLPFKLRRSPPLPSFRVQLQEPFRTVGIDFAGPLYVRQSCNINPKCYILLFTCAASRAVHLELVPDLSAQAFVRGLRRFIGRRGAPHLIISDNAKTFHASEAQEFLLDRKISWKFNVPSAPWTGGFFESMIKITKRCLKKVLLNSRLTYEELNTILTELEGVLNNRPLTYVDNDRILETLTPNHLIFGRRLSPVAESSLISSQAKVVNENDIRKRVVYRQKVLRDFNKRWTKEYLLGLRQAQKSQGPSDHRAIKVDDVVLVYDEGPRLFWRLGRVVELIPSKDNEVRSVKLLLSGNPEHSGHVITRPISRLFPLEIMAADDGKNEVVTESAAGIGDSEGLTYAPTQENAGQPHDGSLHAGRVPGWESQPVYCNYLKHKYRTGACRSSENAAEEKNLEVAIERAFTEERKSKRRAAKEADLKRICNKQI